MLAWHLHYYMHASGDRGRRLFSDVCVGGDLRECGLTRSDTSSCTSDFSDQGGENQIPYSETGPTEYPRVRIPKIA